MRYTNEYLTSQFIAQRTVDVIKIKVLLLFIFNSMSHQQNK